MNQTFNLLPEHLKLMRAAYVRWSSCEYGAPGIDCKRPYGNSDVEGDVCHELGWRPEGDDGQSECWSSRQLLRAGELHAETETVLQILLTHAGQAVEPGLYSIAGIAAKWRKIGPPAPTNPDPIRRTDR